ncbi:MAG: ribosome-associated translation inhibitor RaiA [Firmicutes bacterium]|nr:ribosome-associated translation inhibitor RaiA [Bacillota bacterium]
MRIEFVTKNYIVNEKIKDLISKKLSRLDKFFHEEIPIKVMLKEAGAVQTLELTILLDGMIMRAEVSSDNMFGNVDAALPKLEKQIVKHRSKLTDRSKKLSIKELEQSYVPSVHDEADRKVVRTKMFALKPMTAEDAIAELELVGHNFYVFLNSDSMRVNVLYIRRDGDYGLIQTVND